MCDATYNPNGPEYWMKLHEGVVKALADAKAEIERLTSKCDEQAEEIGALRSHHHDAEHALDLHASLQTEYERFQRKIGRRIVVEQVKIADLENRLHEADTKIAEQAKEIEGLKTTISWHVAQHSVVCDFCGHVFPTLLIGSDDRLLASTQMRHVEECPNNPVSKLIRSLKARVEELEELLR